MSRIHTPAFLIPSTLVVGVLSACSPIDKDADVDLSSDLAGNFALTTPEARSEVSRSLYTRASIPAGTALDASVNCNRKTGLNAPDIMVPDDYSNIQDAIDAASSGDTICVEAGTYYENIDFNGMEVSVIGAQGARHTFIDGGGAGTVVTMDNGESSSTVLQGFTITNGYATSGGGMYLYSVNPTFENLIILGNEATNGGGIYTSYSSFTIDNVLFQNNEASSSGGALYGYLDFFEMNNAVISSNRAGSGAGFRITWGGVDITNAKFIGNEATNYGGALYTAWDSNDIINSVITGNSASRGGGIYAGEASDVEVINTTISDNSASSSGSGAYLDYSYAHLYQDNSNIYNDTCVGSWYSCPTFTHEVDPNFVDTSSIDPLNWDLHLGACSELINAGDTALSDPDGSTSDIGAYGGDGAKNWNIDGDKFFEWWQPGVYSNTYAKLDCNDINPVINPNSDCDENGDTGLDMSCSSDTGSGSAASNFAPECDAGSGQTVELGDEVTLDGSGTLDDDGDSLTYSWTFTVLPSGSSLTDSDIDDSDTDTATFTPDVEGEYGLTLEADDGTDSCSDSVGITAAVAEDYVALSMGYLHGCALSDDGEIACWGATSFDYGQVSDTPTGDEYSAIAAGGYHNCAIDSSDGIECWGWDNYNQLTDAPTGTGYTYVGTGFYHTCAIDSSGGIDCWGYDGYDQVTDTPTGTGYIAVEGGQYHTCAIDSSGEVECWGKSSSVVTDAPTGSGYTALAASKSHTCALDSSGGIDCWGTDTYNQVSNAPTGTGYTMISSGGTGGHVCALDSSGEVECWGWDGMGQSSDSPSGTGYTSASAGFIHSCAIDSDGFIECWGSNQRDQCDAPTGYE